MLIEELVVLGPGRDAQHPLGREGELPARRPRRGHVMHLGRVGEPRGDVHCPAALASSQSWKLAERMFW